jgi:hypothetical protein
MSDEEGPTAMAATASYWIAMQTPAGVPTTWMWNCEVPGCTGAGLGQTEPACVGAMNRHMADVHPDAGYVAPPIPGADSPPPTE